MYKDLIKSWIPNLTPSIIKNYGKKISINLTDDETMIIYQFIMKNYDEILDGKESCFQELQNKLNNNLYEQLLTLYQEKKKKYL